MRSVFLVVLALGLSGCGSGRLGVCGSVPGVPGQVCVELEWKGEKKVLTLPEAALDLAPKAQSAEEKEKGEKALKDAYKGSGF